MYDEKKPLPGQHYIKYDEDSFEDTKFVPYDNQPALGPVTHP